MSNNNELSLINLRNVIETIPGHVYWCNVNGVILGCNQLQAEFFGFQSEKDVVGQTIYDFYPKKQAKFLENATQRTIQENQTITIEELYTQRNGEEIAYYSKKVPLHDTQGRIIGVLGVAFDISSEKEAQQDRTWILEDIIGKMPGHVWWKDKNCLFMGCNDNQAKIASLVSRDEIRGKSAYDVIITDQPEEERVKQAAAIDAIDRKIIQTGKGQIVEEPLILADGRKAIYLSCKEPLRDRHGNIIGLIGMSVDITSEKERAAAENKAKISSILAAGIAHELRTPLAAIDLLGGQLEDFMERLVAGYRQAYSQGLIEEPLKEKEIEIAIDAGSGLLHVARSANMFIDMMLMKVNLEKPKARQLIKLSMCGAVKDALQAYPFDDSERDLIVWDTYKNQENNFSFMGDQTLFNHVLFNLIKNALYYVKTAHKGNIEVWLVKDKKHNFLHFKDTGAGISANVLPHIFDAFYTKTAHGTGVGLALCKVIMQEFGGDIRCDSVEGEYTHFMLKFPTFKKESKK